MNKKQPYVPLPGERVPEYLTEVRVRNGGKTFLLVAGQCVSVTRRVGLMAGRYTFKYAEYDGDSLFLYVDGPIGRHRRRRMIRESDIKTVHRGVR